MSYPLDSVIGDLRLRRRQAPLQSLLLAGIADHGFEVVEEAEAGQ